MLGQAEQRLAQFRIAPETLRAVDQPQIQLVLTPRTSEISSV